jgi:hypothetical protein
VNPLLAALQLKPIIPIITVIITVLLPLLRQLATAGGWW